MPVYSTFGDTITCSDQPNLADKAQNHGRGFNLRSEIWNIMPHFTDSPHSLYAGSLTRDHGRVLLDRFQMVDRAFEAKKEVQCIKRLWYIKEIERLEKGASPGLHEMGCIPQSILEKGLHEEWETWVP